MRKYIFATLLTALIAPLGALAASRADSIAAELHNPESKRVLVVAHRGDWRSWPENSLPAMQSAIDQGADIIELDIHMTADSVLVVCHDAKVDRTTTGRGRISELSYDSIASLSLRTGHGIATSLPMPTLREALELCRDKAVVNIDKGYEYYDQALALCHELGVAGQVLIKGKALPADVESKLKAHTDNMMYMPIVEVQKERGQALWNAYKERAEVPMAVEVCWSTCGPDVDAAIAEIRDAGAKIWVNSLWPKLNGGLCDDAAAMASDPAEIYDALLSTGATIVQTDRIGLLVSYLRKRGLHP